MRTWIPYAVLVIDVLLAAPAGSQVLLRPTPSPVVTAEQESWYLSGEPITFNGHVYYPAGPDVFFNPYEMVRSGFYRGIPLYSRTTIEPYSVVFVPVARGLMQPYERRRSGDVAGTAGSAVPSFPVDRGIESTNDELLQAPSAPTMMTPVIGTWSAYAHHRHGRITRTAPAADVPPPPTGPLRSARLPEGLNSFFVEYDGRRWFSSGPALEFDASAFTRVGQYHGFPVYARDQREDTIYVSVIGDTEGLLAPYSARR
jgi:hypothetical protein